MGRVGGYCIEVALLGDIQQAVVLRMAGKVQASDEANDRALRQLRMSSCLFFQPGLMPPLCLPPCCDEHDHNVVKGCPSTERQMTEVRAFTFYEFLK